MHSKRSPEETNVRLSLHIHGGPARGSTGDISRRRLLAGSLALPVILSLPSTRVSNALAQPPVEPPPWQERYVLDSETIAWDDFGPRMIEGVVLHRLTAPLDGADSFIRTLPPGGTNFCDPTYGGCTALYDFGVDNNTGAIYVWNDPLGASHPGVSPDRSPWANGPVMDPNGNARAFLDQKDGEVESINRDQVSIAISGGFDDPISDDGLLAIAWLSAYLADEHFQESADQYPDLPSGFSFVRLHSEFNSRSDCPGNVVESQLDEIYRQTREVMDFYRNG